jgi:hypothetical protein
LETVARELAKLDTVGVEEVRWDKDGAESTNDYHISTEMGMLNFV